MGEFSRVGSRTFVYWIATRVAVSFLVSVALTLALYLLSYSINYMTLPINLKLDPGAIVTAGTLAFLLLAAASLVTAVVQYENWGYHIDEHSLFLRRGFIAVDTETIPFFKVINTSFSQTAWQRPFGVGQLVIEQEDDSSVWSSIDKRTAAQIMEIVSTKGNIQPIAVSSSSFRQI